MANPVVRPFVSVIVASKTWTPDCNMCLQSLLEQDYPSDRFEIIFSLQPNGGSLETMPKWASKPGVSVVTSPEAGISSQRNYGVAQSRGSLVAFTDSDARPYHDWLSRLVECAERSQADIVGGKVVTDLERYLPPLLQANITGRSRALRPRTGSVLYVKSAIIEAGGFDSAFKRAEDYDLYLRVQARGHKAVFCEDAIVFHKLKEIGFKGLWKLSRDGKYHVLLFKRHPTWAREYLQLKWRFTRTTIAVWGLLFSIALSAFFVSLFNFRVALVLPFAAYAGFAVVYCRTISSNGARLTLPKAILGSLGMAAFSLCAFVWKVEGSIRFKTLIL